MKKFHICLVLLVILSSSWAAPAPSGTYSGGMVFPGSPVATPSPGIPPAIADLISSKLTSKMGPKTSSLGASASQTATGTTSGTAGMPPGVAAFVRSIIAANQEPAI